MNSLLNFFKGHTNIILFTFHITFKGHTTLLFHFSYYLIFGNNMLLITLFLISPLAISA